MFDPGKLIEYASEEVVRFGPRIIGAIAVLVIGMMIAKSITKMIGKALDKQGFEKSLKLFLESLVGVLLKILVVLSAMSTLGVALTSFVAILGAAGLAVGMALSGTLQNFAGGVMILIFKPFKAGDVIEAQGVIGSVQRIEIFNTILHTPDNKTIILPNGGLSNSIMTNYSTQERRRVDFTFGIGYGDDVDTAKEVLLRLIKEDKRILDDPAAPFIAVSALADSSVNLTVRVWAKGADYWGIFFDLNEKVYKEFGKSGLNIPYPQMDVHVHNS